MNTQTAVTKRQIWNVTAPGRDAYPARNANDALAHVKSIGRVLSSEELGDKTEYCVKTPDGVLIVTVEHWKQPRAAWMKRH